ncbi:3-methyl-2-oxobutanoate hydroxymethyltransferase [Streptomyces axinellae]|uniref:3-methyl-2-oxobutanoate hydroxymethyltransferase n=1 Tax=Streptomyces axinellae TaxID=552788 RepID=A0ABN3QR79_9ACTN
MSSDTESASALYGRKSEQRVTVRELAQAKRRQERWVMLTAYDALTAGLFDEQKVPALLVGDSAANVVYGFDSTVRVGMDHLMPLVQAVVRGTRHALVVADMPFGSYQDSVTTALTNATRFLQEGGAQAVKLEGGARVVDQVSALVEAGIPVMGHLGLTPQSVHALGGYRVQGRAEAGEQLLADAKALAAAGAFALVLEVVPSDLARRVTAEVDIPTIGIGAGADCDAQVLVWQDLAGLTPAPAPKFVKRYADMRSQLAESVGEFIDDVAAGRYPDSQHCYS